MVTFKENDKNLVIPSALGNFPSNGGGEGGLTPEEAQEMIDASISGYNETVQAEFANTNSGVSANTQAIEDLSGATSEISSDLAALSAYTETLPSDLSNYATTAETEQISANLSDLSGITAGLETDVDNLGVDVENLSAATSGIAVDLETLSAYTATLSGGSGSEVSYTQTLTAGTQIGQITINGSATTIYAPEGGSDIVQNYQIVSALTDVEGEEGTVTLSGFSFNFSAVTKNTIGDAWGDNWSYNYFTIIDAISAPIPDFWPVIDNTGFYLFNGDGSNIVLIADDNTWHNWENAEGKIYYYRRNGYDIDILLAEYPEDIVINAADMETWEESDEVATGDTTSTVTSTVIKEGTVAYLTTDGKFYQYLSGNWSEIPQGGGSEQNYVIVDALSAITNPVEGMTAWVNSGTANIGPYTVISFNASECSGGYLSWDGDNAYLTGDDPTQIDNGHWYTPTENWGAVGGRSNLLAKYDSSTHIVSIMFAFNVTNLSVNIYDTTYSETSESLSVDYDGYFARRIKGNWIRNEYHLEKMAPAELAQAHSEIITMSGQSYTDIFWQTQDGGITKATYWMIDWNDSAAVRCVACQGDSWYTMKFSSDGSISEKGSGRVTDKVAKWEFNWDRATSAWTAAGFEMHQGYQTWGGDKMIEASIYEYNTDPVGKLSCGNPVYFWRKTDTDMYSDYYFGFHFIDADGTEWKTVWYASNWQATFVSMTQI